MANGPMPSTFEAMFVPPAPLAGHTIPPLAVKWILPAKSQAFPCALRRYPPSKIKLLMVIGAVAGAFEQKSATVGDRQ